MAQRPATFFQTLPRACTQRSRDGTPRQGRRRECETQRPLGEFAGVDELDGERRDIDCLRISGAAPGPQWLPLARHHVQ